jgi:hypothetical protein
MAVYNGAYPVLPGKVDAARAFAAAVAGPRRAEFDEMQRNAKTSRETWSFQEMPGDGGLVLVWFEADDVEHALAQAFTDTSEFGQWFVAQVHDITGLDMSQPPDVAPPEVVLDWSA